MRLKTFLATYMLFVLIFFTSLGVVSVHMTNSQFGMLREKSAAEFKPFNFKLYDAGRSITFNVTDDTGRAALVSVYMDTKQAVNLDTSGSDFIPGYSFEGEGGEG